MTEAEYGLASSLAAIRCATDALKHSYLDDGGHEDDEIAAIIRQLSKLRIRLEERAEMLVEEDQG